MPAVLVGPAWSEATPLAADAGIQPLGVENATLTNAERQQAASHHEQDTSDTGTDGHVHRRVGPHGFPLTNIDGWVTANHRPLR
ncbi:MAG: hypothetical protein QOH97_5779 [Actinoplanes sp.]|jgi:hypothetical protein|nr:hypothetical protein [Actinoplanes sp.]